MIAAAIDKIVSMAKPVIVEVGGEKYSTGDLRRVPAELRAEPIEVATLTSLVQYILDFPENKKKIPAFVHVISHKRVELLTALDSDRKRECLMIVKSETPEIPFGRYLENENMIIAIQSMFKDDPQTDKEAILRFTGTVTSGSIKEYGDDGVTQKATIKQGVASKTEAIVPSPCLLRPYRTFAEVEQPASKFIFRMRELREDVIESALFEADGGAWKNEARENIRNYLETKLRTTNIKVIA